jgi:AcrR family transcriptional regulator
MSIFDVSAHFNIKVLRYRGPMVKASSQTRRERILSATVELIRRDGIAALTTKGIATEAGCAEGTIFRHFGDKGGLIAAVLAHGLPEVYRLEEIALHPPDADLESGLQDLCSAVLDFYRTSYPVAAAALADATIFRRYQAAHQAAGTGPRQIWGLVHDYLVAAREAGLVSTDVDLEIEAITLTGACQNAVWVSLVNGSEALPHGGVRFVEQLVTSQLAALAPREVNAP